MSAHLLVQTLQGMAAWRAGLKAAVQASSDRPCVYYVCPLANLRGIAEHGILPRDAAPQKRTDLSGQSVQAIRNEPLLLSSGMHAGVHQCVNFFWNPLNWTLSAFQSIGLRREASSKNPDDAVVCILEIDLERLLVGTGCGWTVAPQNLAGSNFANFTSDYFTGAVKRDDGTPSFDWERIFSTEPTNERSLNRKRSAELIVSLDNPTDVVSSSPVPFNLVDRIIVPAAEVRALTQDQTDFLSRAGKAVTRLSKAGEVTIFIPQEDLRKAENGFVTSLHYRKKSDGSVLTKLNAAFRTIREFETAHPELCPSGERFLRAELADGYHGSLHAARVMFWCAFLIQHVNGETRNAVTPIVLTAAALHDTCRESGDEDELHGQRAAEAHRARVEGFLTSPGTAASCLNAIRYHAVPDEGCPSMDLALQILKDGDALDRGRFGAPNTEVGCKTRFFRTQALRGDAYNNVAWMAYWAAYSTRYTPVGPSPCKDFNKALVDSVNVLAGKKQAG